MQQDNYAPGTQLSNVNGDVLKWHNDLGAQSVSAQVYIQQLEAEIAHLKQQQVWPDAPSIRGQKAALLLVLQANYQMAYTTASPAACKPGRRRPLPTAGC